MATAPQPDTAAHALMRACIQKVATGPEYSKDLSADEAQGAMSLILEGRADPVQAGIFLIALRMKRETQEENRGVLRALLDVTETAVADVDDELSLADPYYGYARQLPASPFLPAVLAACDVPIVSHGLEFVGPKYGITHRKVLRAAGIDVDLSPMQAAQQIGDADVGWAYVDQRAFCAPLHDLVDLRTRMVKRPCLTTVEVLARPVAGRRRSHLLTGYVHKAYPEIYTDLAREAGFDSAVVVRGAEGGVIPSLQQVANACRYVGEGDDEHIKLQPSRAGIERDTRGVPLPDHLHKAQGADDIDAGLDPDAAARASAEAGLAALAGDAGPTRDSLIYASAIVLLHLGRCEELAAGADRARQAIDSGAARSRFESAARVNN